VPYADRDRLSRLLARELQAFRAAEVLE